MEQIGRYRILEEVGRGAMGVVYRAQDPAIGRIIAIKTIRLNDLSDLDERQRLRDRLFREAQAAGILSHPNIVTIYDIAEENGQACIFMEFVNGPSLEALLSSHQAADKQNILDIFRQTAGALDYAHRKGIVHRDIKPANIMIHEDGQAKITDFGVAKVISQQMTHSGSMMGTPNYMSPEQVQGAKMNGRADQFSLAVVAYEILTGEKPFAGEYLPTLLYKIVRESPVAPSRLNPSLGTRIEQVLGKALEKDPAARYPTCTEFVNAWVEACNATPGWVPLPRGSSPNLPTLAEAATPRLKPEGAPALPVPPRPLRREDPEPERNPLFRSVIWLLVGIGLVGLVLLGAQKFLFNPSANSSSDQAASSAPAPADTSKPADTPSRQPDSDQPAPSKPSPSGELPGEKTENKEPPPAPKPSPLPARPAVPDNAREGGKPGTEREVQLVTDPAGAIVTVDGNPSLSCRTPCLLSLSQGRHTLTTQLDGYRPYPRILNVPEDGDVFLKLAKAVGTLNITSNPSGASIAINGEMKPQRTPASFALPPGEYRIRVVRDGVPLDFSIQVREGEFYTRNVSFQ